VGGWAEILGLRAATSLPEEDAGHWPDGLARLSKRKSTCRLQLRAKAAPVPVPATLPPCRLPSSHCQPLPAAARQQRAAALPFVS